MYPLSGTLCTMQSYSVIMGLKRNDDSRRSVATVMQVCKHSMIFVIGPIAHLLF